MTDIIENKIKYNSEIISSIKKTKALKDHKLIFAVKENKSNHYWDRDIVFEINKVPEFKLNEEGLLSFIDEAGARAGISLNMFESINGIKLDSWRN